MKHFGKSILFMICFAVLVSLPFVAGAQDVKTVSIKITELIGSSLIKLVFTIGFLYFFWGVVQYVINPEEEKKAKGKQMIITGLLGLTIMFAVYSLITIIRNTFTLTSNVPEKIPVLPK